MIEVEHLTVRFAGVTPLDDVSVVFSAGTCGLIGPNGAGKTTFFNVLSGFVKPAAGSISAFGENMLKLADYRRARWGLRRTFQTEMAIERLSVFDNVAMIHEHSGAKRASRRTDVLAAIAFVGLDISPKVKVGSLAAGRAAAGRDRPRGRRDAPADAARRARGRPSRRGDGAPHRRDPADPGADRRAGRSSSTTTWSRLGCCQTTAVLDFGKLIASGPTAEVLRDEHVMRAYLGTEEEV